MISPETLRRHPFFARFSHDQLRILAMIGEEIHYKDQETILRQGEAAKAFYFLIDGVVDLYYTVQEAYLAKDRREVPVSQVVVGEPFGISALIEPNILTSTARSCQDSTVIRFDAEELRKAFVEDVRLEILLTHQAAKTAIERLHATRVQLAAAWS